MPLPFMPIGIGIVAPFEIDVFDSDPDADVCRLVMGFSEQQYGLTEGSTVW